MGACRALACRGREEGGGIRVIQDAYLRGNVVEVIEEIVGSLDVGERVVKGEDGAVGLHQPEALGRLRLKHRREYHHGEHAEAEEQQAKAPLPTSLKPIVRRLPSSWATLEREIDPVPALTASPNQGTNMSLGL